MTDFRPDASHSDRGRGVSPVPASDYLGTGSFGDLVFLEEVESRTIERADGRRYIRLGRFQCACGNSTIAELRNVKRGLTRSCGCKAVLPPKSLAQQENNVSTTTPADGRFIIHKEDNRRQRRRHSTEGKATAEAQRLQSLNPDDTFVISQEIARVGPNG